MVLTRNNLKKSKSKGTRKVAKSKKAVAQPMKESEESEVESAPEDSEEFRPDSANAIRARIERDRAALARSEKAKAVSAQIAVLEAERIAGLAGEIFSPAKTKRVSTLRCQSCLARSAAVAIRARTSILRRTAMEIRKMRATPTTVRLTSLTRLRP